jgi:hypothetical protein
LLFPERERPLFPEEKHPERKNTMFLVTPAQVLLLHKCGHKCPPKTGFPHFNLAAKPEPDDSK